VVPSPKLQLYWGKVDPVAVPVIVTAVPAVPVYGPPAPIVRVPNVPPVTVAVVVALPVWPLERSVTKTDTV
jgi:hypothetical protein